MAQTLPDYNELTDVWPDGRGPGDLPGRGPGRDGDPG